MSSLGFLSCFTSPRTLHVLTNNNSTQELQGTEQESLFGFGASLCKSLHLLNSSSFLYSFSPLPSVPRSLSRLLQSSMCSLSGGTWQMTHLFVSPQKGHSATVSAERSFRAGHPAAPQRWAAAPRLRVPAPTSGRPSRLRPRSGCVPWLLPRHCKAHPALVACTRALPQGGFKVKEIWRIFS